MSKPYSVLLHYAVEVTVDAEDEQDAIKKATDMDIDVTVKSSQTDDIFSYFMESLDPIATIITD